MPEAGLGLLAWISTDRNWPNAGAVGSVVDEAERLGVPPRDGNGFVEDSGGEDDGEVGAAMEADGDFAVRDGDVGGHVDEVAEDEAGLGLVVAAHAACQEAVESGGEDEERHVEVDLESDRGGERVDVEEADGVGQGIF